MDEIKKNESIQSRREFFKKAAKTALPILGIAFLASNPFIAKASTVMDCSSRCSGRCSSGCMLSCKSVCAENCGGKTENFYCGGGCEGCRGRCTGCSGECYGSCSGSCNRSSASY